MPSKVGKKTKGVRTNTTVALAAHSVLRAPVAAVATPRPSTPPPPAASAAVPLSVSSNLEGTPSSRTRSKIRMYEKARQQVSLLTHVGGASEASASTPPHGPAAENSNSGYATPPPQSIAHPSLSSSSDLLPPPDLTVERTRLAHKCVALALACRTQLAQFGDVQGLIAKRHGILCDERVLESASRVANATVTPACIAAMGAVFPDLILVEWLHTGRALSTSSSSAYPSDGGLGGMDSHQRVVPRVRVSSDQVPDVSDLVQCLADRFPADSELAAALAAASRQAKNARPSTAVAASPLKPAVPVRPTMIDWGTDGIAEQHITNQLAEFLSPAKANAVKQLAAYRAHTLATGAVAKVASQCAMDIVVPSYDRLRTYIGTGFRGHTIGVQRACELLKQLNTDLRPVDDATSVERVKLLLSFEGFGFSLRGPFEEGVITFDKSGGSRGALLAAVVERSLSVA